MENQNKSSKKKFKNKILFLIYFLAGLIVFSFMSELFVRQHGIPISSKQEIPYIIILTVTVTSMLYSMIIDIIGYDFSSYFESRLLPFIVGNMILIINFSFVMWSVYGFLFKEYF